MLLKGEPVLLHDPEDPLGVADGLALLAPLPVEQCRHAATAIGGSLVDDRAQFGKKSHIIGLPIRSARLGWLAGALDQVGPGYAKCAGNNAHWVSSSGLFHDSKGEVLFWAGEIHGLSEDLGLHGLLAEHALEIAHALLQIANPGSANNIFISLNGRVAMDRRGVPTPIGTINH
jgi:hypothetical protein